VNLFRVRDAGALTTLQDGGRAGHLAAGVSESGAFDPFALEAVNRLVGNPAGAAALEVTVVGPKLEALADVTVAVGGADLGAHVDGMLLPPWRAVGVRRGSVIGFGRRRSGCRSYFAAGGGFAAPLMLGSRATDLRSGFGGARLAAGVTLTAAGRPGRPSALDLAARATPIYADVGELRVIAGPEDGWFAAGAFAALLAGPWRISPESDRTGVRLTGPALARREGDLLSVPVLPGHVQVPPSGQPQVLGPECGALGGYPRIACVIAADRPRLAQAFPGEAVRFTAIALDDARWLLSGQRALLAEV